MLVLVTLVCIYLGWAMNWKRQREAFLEHPNASGETPHDDLSAPFWIRIVGAPAYDHLALKDPTEHQLLEARRLFPEASIWYSQGGQVKVYRQD